MKIYDLYWYSNHKMLTAYVTDVSLNFTVKTEMHHKYIDRN